MSGLLIRNVILNEEVMVMKKDDSTIFVYPINCIGKSMYNDDGSFLLLRERETVRNDASADKRSSGLENEKDSSRFYE